MVPEVSGRTSGSSHMLTLYVTGMSPRSTEAVSAVTAVCDEALPGSYDLEIVDLYEQPERAQRDGVAVAPTLVRALPLPVRRIVGNLGDVARIRSGLGLAAAGGRP